MGGACKVQICRPALSLRAVRARPVIRDAAGPSTPTNHTRLDVSRRIFFRFSSPDWERSSKNDDSASMNEMQCFPFSSSSGACKVMRFERIDAASSCVVICVATVSETDEGLAGSKRIISSVIVPLSLVPGTDATVRFVCPAVVMKLIARPCLSKTACRSTDPLANSSMKC